MYNKSEKLINIEEFVSVNGVNHYLFHSGTSYDIPVLLYLHGGPRVLNLFCQCVSKLNRRNIYDYSLGSAWCWKNGLLETTISTLQLMSW